MMVEVPMEPSTIIIYALLASICGAIGLYVGYSDDVAQSRGTLGFWCGFLLGPIGILIIAIVVGKPTQRTVTRQ